VCGNVPTSAGRKRIVVDPLWNRDNRMITMNAYSPEERDCLALALARLADAGIVQPASPAGYQLTEKGLSGVRALRRSRP
jgi:hypothetical protein